MISRRCVGAFACASAMLAGCGALRPPPPRPPVDDPPASWQRPGGEAAIEAHWWRGFGDPLLERYVERALERNTDLRAAMARVAEARAAAQAEHGAELPQLGFGAGVERIRAISDVFLRPYFATNNKLAFDASYEVDLRGRLAALSAASDATLAASEAARDATALAVASATAAAYINLLALDERLALARRTLEARSGALTVARSRQQSGHTSSFELAQAQAEYSSTAGTIPQLELAAERQANALAALLDQTPGEIVRGRGLMALAAPPVPALGVPSSLVRRRPDIAAAESQVAASDAQLAAARAQMLPAVQLSAEFGRVGSTIFRNGPFSIWSIGGSILAPIFNGGRLQAGADAAASRRDESILSYRKTVVNAFVEVEDQLAALVHVQEQARQAEDQRTAVAEALRIARNRYREGYASYLEELDAQRTLFTAEQTVAQLRADLLTVHVNLFRALGGGWTPTSQPPDTAVARSPP
jgi:NodT family efflux transporter outer membrane factor (OMF) lipoprotein